MKTSIDQINKISAGIIIFVISIYFSTMIHEMGHVIFFSIFGCKSANLWISPFIVGFSKCYDPKNLELTVTQNIFSGFGGILFTGMVSIALLLIHKLWYSVRKYYVLNLIFYFFAFSTLLSGFLQSIKSVDSLKLIDEFDVNRVYLHILSSILGILLIYQIFKFKDLLKTVEPKIKMNYIKKWYILFLGLISIFSIGYFLL